MIQNRFEVAGVHYRMPDFKRADLKAGDTITLVPDPANEHDPNAIKVMKGDIHIGYVPRDLNRFVLENMAKGTTTCTVQSKHGRTCLIDVETHFNADNKVDKKQ